MLPLHRLRRKSRPPAGKGKKQQENHEAGGLEALHKGRQVRQVRPDEVKKTHEKTQRRQAEEAKNSPPSIEGNEARIQKEAHIQAKGSTRTKGGPEIEAKTNPTTQGRVREQVQGVRADKGIKEMICARPISHARKGETGTLDTRERAQRGQRAGKHVGEE